jgi:RNA polymerase primary sigma factor
MTLDTMTTAIKKLIARGKERGHVTVDELNAALPSEQVSSELIEDTMAMLNDIGINVVERGGPEDGGTAIGVPRKPLCPLPLRSGAEAPLDRSQDRCSDVTSPTR